MIKAMNITEKSKKYAEGKAIDAISAAIEKAYADGYNDGLKHYENERLESIVDGVEYIDLKLTSETKWASGYLKEKASLGWFADEDASKLNLPTKEDFEELCKECAIDNYLYTNNKGIMFTGKNGKKIEIPYIKAIHVTDDNVNDSIAFWLKNEGEDTQKEYARVNSSRKVLDVKTFMGYKLPVLLVLKKDKCK